MRRPRYEWDPRPPTTGERTIVGLWLAALLIVVASDLADCHLLRGYEKQAEGLLGILMVVLFARVLPGVRRSDS